MLLRYLDYQVLKERLLDDIKTKLTTLSTNISLYFGPDENHQFKLWADSSETCNGVLSSGKHYIEYSFPAFQKKIVSSSDVFKRLMGSQNKLHLSPRKDDTKQEFPTLFLYNHLIDGYEKEEIGVVLVDLPGLETLTLAVRNLLQSLHGRVKSKHLPERFRHGLKQDEDKRLCTSSKAMVEKVKLLSHSTSVSLFLVQKSWGNFHDDIILLQEIAQKAIQRNQENTQLVLSNQKQEERYVEEKFRNVSTIEPISNPASCYDSLTTTLLKLGDYKELLITSDLIDKWRPSTIQDESLELARQRQGRFRRQMVLLVAVRLFKLDAGGSRELIFVIWKVPLDPDNCCETTDAQLLSSFLAFLQDKNGL